MECQTVYKETQLQSINNPSAIDRFFNFKISSTSTTGIMEAKLLAAVSLLLVVGQFTGDHDQNRILKYSLTLGTHVQRGLLYLVCVSVCVCVCVCLSVCLHLFLPYRDQAGSLAIPTALAQQGLEKLCGDFA